jgi:hypothetical protein
MVIVELKPKFSKGETISILLDFSTQKDLYLKPANNGFNVFLCVVVNPITGP